MTITLIQDDCLAAMKAMPDNSVSMVLTSPPYENLRSYSELKFNLSGQKWVDWCVERWIECNRICSGLVAWVVEGQTRKFQWSATPALLMADLHRAGIKLRKPPAYCRVGIPGSGGPDWLRNDFEFICCSSKGRLPWSDNVACGKPCKYGPGGKLSHRLSNDERINVAKMRDMVSSGECNQRDAARKSGVKLTTGTSGFSSGKDLALVKGYVPPEKANPGNLFQATVGGSRMGHPLAHENEAPFSLDMAAFFVKSFCPPGGTCLDIFAGSSTTGQACVENGRNYVGIDLRQSQIDLSKRRLGIT